MTRTGTVKPGQSDSFYSSGGYHTKGKSVCRARQLPANTLDALVTTAAEAELKETGGQLARLYKAIEEGMVELISQLKDRIATLKSARDLAQASFERMAEQVPAATALTPERIDAFAKLLNEKIETSDIQARKAYLRAIIQEIRIDDGKIQIVGDKASLVAVMAGQKTEAGRVSGFVRKWRARKDSNL